MTVDIDAADTDTDADVDVVDVLRVLGDPVRWRIAELLAAEELCVCHLVTELDVAQPLVSHHLGAMRQAGLVETKRFRYWTYYRLRSGVVAHLADHLSALATPHERQRRPCC